MLQGVHAETIVFTGYRQARSSVLDPDRPLLRTPGEVQLGERARRFRIRAREVRESGKALTCQIDLHDGGRPLTIVMRIELSFAPDGANTRVKLRGSTVRNLTAASPTQDETSRKLANEYARGLLEHLAREIEARAAENSRANGPSMPPAVARKHS